MSARRIGAAVCASLALTLGSAGVAFAYGTDSSSAPSPTQDPCFDDGGGTVLRGTNGDDNLKAGTNVRTICAFGGNDTIYANDLGDYIYAGPGNDTIYGGAGNDHIEGQGGDDTIHDDGIYGGGGDTLLGQTGNDTIYANNGVADVVDGGTGANKCAVDTGPTVFDNIKNCIIQ